MKLISFEDIRRLGIDPADCLNWVEEGLLNKNGAQLSPKMSLQPIWTPDGTFVNTMPCFVDYIGRGGVKVVSRYPHRVPVLSSEILLYGSKTGECLALLDGDWITAMRAGAVAV